MSQAVVKVAAFDFDHTIINVNSDTYIDKLIGDVRYPDEIEQLHSLGWTRRMNAVFEYMRKKCDIQKSDLLDCLREIKIDDSMIELIRKLQQNSYELVIVSDANDIFIDEILRVNGLGDAFSSIYTNRGEFDQDGQLIVKPFNEIFNENGDPFDCSTKICTSNICKGSVLAKHLEQKSNSDKKLVYVGDGRNDYCPGLYLNKNDFYYVRSNHSLEKLLRKDPSLAEKLAVNVSYWKSAQDILENLNSSQHF